MPARRRRPSASSITPAGRTRSARCTKAPRRWTGWSRSRSAASRSPRPRRPASGTRPASGHTASTSSTRRATSTSRSRSSVAARARRRGRVFDSVAGVEPQSETVWRQADKYGVPRICFVNKMDRIGADFPRCVDMISDRLGAKPLVTQLPIGIEASSRASSIWCRNKAINWRDETLGAKFDVVEIPADLKEQAAEWRHKLVEMAVEQDDAALEVSRRRGAGRRDAEQVHPQGHDLRRLRAGAVRLGVQEQGRAAAARRRRRLPAGADRRAGRQGHQDGHRRADHAAVATTSRSRRSPSRS